MKALLKNYHQSPRKVRLVANLIRGKSVAQARLALGYLPKKSAPQIAKLLESAVSNARSAGVSTDELYVKTITVNKGSVLHRFMPMARGRASRYAKTMSIVALELGSKTASAPKAAPKEEKVEGVKKVVAKKTAKKAAKKTAKAA